MVISRAEPEVRIHLPPAGSLRTIGPSAAEAFAAAIVGVSAAGNSPRPEPLEQMIADPKRVGDDRELTDLDITTDDNLAYGHSIQRVAGTDKQGKKLD